MLEGILTAGFWVIVIWVTLEDSRFLHIPWPAPPLLGVMGMIYAYRLGGFDQWVSHILGGLVIWLALTLIGLSFKKLRGIDGLGTADPIYAGALSIWISPFAVSWAIAAACVITLALGTLLNQHQRGAAQKIPFAPGLGLGFGICLVIDAVWPGMF